jgi:hypothetical protein
MTITIATYNIDERIPQTSNVLRSMAHLAAVPPRRKATAHRRVSDFCDAEHAAEAESEQGACQSPERLFPLISATG